MSGARGKTPKKVQERAAAKTALRKASKSSSFPPNQAVLGKIADEMRAAARGQRGKCAKGCSLNFAGQHLEALSSEIRQETNPVPERG